MKWRGIKIILTVNKNNEIHIQQYDYLLKRYLLNIEREKRHQYEAI